MSGTNLRSVAAASAKPLEGKRIEAVARLAAGARYSAVSAEMGLPPGLVADWGRAALASGELATRIRPAIADLVRASAQARVAVEPAPTPVEAVPEPIVVEHVAEIPMSIPADDPPVGTPVEEVEAIPDEAIVVVPATRIIGPFGPFLAEWVWAAGGTSEGVEILMHCAGLQGSGFPVEEVAAVVGLEPDVVLEIWAAVDAAGILSEDATFPA